MAIVFLALDNELVADLAPDNQDDDRIFLDIIQDTKVKRPQFKLSERIRTQALDRVRDHSGLVFQPGQNGVLQCSPIACWP
jgi:hypothetical protein